MEGPWKEEEDAKMPQGMRHGSIIRLDKQLCRKFIKALRQSGAANAEWHLQEIELAAAGKTQAEMTGLALSSKVTPSFEPREWEAFKITMGAEQNELLTQLRLTKKEIEKTLEGGKDVDVANLKVKDW